MRMLLYTPTVAEMVEDTQIDGWLGLDWEFDRDWTALCAGWIL